MDTYCVTFRIADKVVNGRSYAERRQQLIENVYQDGCGYWEGTTSFFLIESDLNTPTFCAHAVKGLSEEHDIVVVFDPKDMSASYFGRLKHPDVLRYFFPRLQNSSIINN